jgi:hypothetical protein
MLLQRQNQPGLGVGCLLWLISKLLCDEVPPDLGGGRCSRRRRWTEMEFTDEIDVHDGQGPSCDLYFLYGLLCNSLGQLSLYPASVFACVFVCCPCLVMQIRIIKKKLISSFLCKHARVHPPPVPMPYSRCYLIWWYTIIFLQTFVCKSISTKRLRSCFWFRPWLVFTLKLYTLSHRMFEHMYGVLNIN